MAELYKKKESLRRSPGVLTLRKPGRGRTKSLSVPGLHLENLSQSNKKSVTEREVEETKYCLPFSPFPVGRAPCAMACWKSPLLSAIFHSRSCSRGLFCELWEFLPNIHFPRCCMTLTLGAPVAADWTRQGTHW